MGVAPSEGVGEELGTGRGGKGAPQDPAAEVDEIYDVVEVRWLGDHRIFLRFENGAEGEVDLSTLAFRNMLAPLKDPEYFARVFVDQEAGTVAWPNGVELDPLVLYHQLLNRPLPIDRILPDTP
jgi:uncharacterized protein DUF2442